MSSFLKLYAHVCPKEDLV